MGLARTCAPGITAAGGGGGPPSYVTPSIGDVEATPQNTTTDYGGAAATFETTTGDMLVAWFGRSNGSPSPQLTDVDATDLFGTISGVIAVAGGDNGANNICGGVAWLRNLVPGEFDIDVTLSAVRARDSVIICADVVNMLQSGSPIGAVLAVPSGTSDDEISHLFTPTDADSLVVVFQGVNVGSSANPATGIGCTKLVSSPTGGATDISGAIGAAAAGTTAERAVGFDWAANTTEQITLVVELLPGET